MAPKYLFLSTIALVLLFTSCQDRKEIQKVLTHAEALVDSQPDSAMAILESIPQPEDLPKDQRMEYSLLLLQAKDKCYHDITTDTTIVLCKHYFLQQKNWAKATLAAFYCGRVHCDRNDYKQALEAFLEADACANNANNNNTSGLIKYNIGGIHYAQHHHENAIVYFKQAAEYFDKENNHNYNIASLKMLGNSFQILNMVDSALIYYNKALDIAKAINDVTIQSSILKNISVIYSDQRNFAQAEKYLQQAATLSLNDEEQALLLVNLTALYKSWGKLNLSLNYANKALELVESGKDKKTATFVYSLLSEIEEKRGNYKQALIYHQHYTNVLSEIYIEDINQSVLGIQEKYNFEVIKNANQQLQLEKQGMLLMLLAVGSALLVLAFSFNMYRLRSKRKLLESQNQLYELREMAADFKEHKSTHRDALLYQLSIMKQVKVLHSYFLKEDKEKTIVKKINEAVFGNENGDNWNGFYKIIDELCDGFLYRVKERFTELDESEFRVICLTCFDFHNKEIAAFMELSVDTIQLRKKNIRRKLDIGQRGDIIAFMKEKLGENKAR